MDTCRVRGQSNPQEYKPMAQSTSNGEGDGSSFVPVGKWQKLQCRQVMALPSKGMGMAAERRATTRRNLEF